MRGYIGPMSVMANLEGILEEARSPLFVEELPEGITGYTKLFERAKEIGSGIIRLELYPKFIVLNKETYKRILKGDVGAIKNYYHEVGHENTEKIYYRKKFSIYVDDYLELIAEIRSYIYLERHGKLEDYLKKIREDFGKRAWTDEYWMINILESYALKYGTKYLDKLTELVKYGSITMEDLVTYLTWKAGGFYIASKDIRKILNFYRNLGWKIYEVDSNSYVLKANPKVFERYAKVEFLLLRYFAS